MNRIAPLGETIRDRRLALGYSLGQLATKVNKTASSIRAWEKGDAFPDEDEASALAGALDLDSSLLVRLLPDSEVWQADPVLPVDVHDPWNEDNGSAAEEDSADGDQAAETSEDTAEPSNRAAVDSEIVDDDSERTEEDDVEAPSGENAADAGEAPATADAESIPGIGPLRPRARPESLQDAMTEAVPVVPRAAVAVAEPPRFTASPGDVAEQTRINSNPVLAAWDEIVRLYHRVFDPSRPWIYRIRFVLLLIAFFIMLRVLAWAGSNLLDAIGEVLDSFSFSPTETPDVQN